MIFVQLSYENKILVCEREKLTETKLLQKTLFVIRVQFAGSGGPSLPLGNQFDPPFQPVLPLEVSDHPS